MAWFTVVRGGKVITEGGRWVGAERGILDRTMLIFGEGYPDEMKQLGQLLKRYPEARKHWVVVRERGEEQVVRLVPAK